MRFLPVIGFWTIWFTPAIFVISLIEAIKAIKDWRDYGKYGFVCCVSLMLIVIPMYAMLMYV